jgi:DNA-binding beta-propeller fold protein YncE
VIRGLVVIFVTLAMPAGAAHAESSLVLDHAISMPSVDGRIDHLTLDAAGQRLFVAALGNNSVEVIDLHAAKRERSLPGLPGPQDVVWLPEPGQLLVSCGGDGTCRLLDGVSFKEVARTSHLDDADNMRRDAHDSRVFVGYGDGALAILAADAKLLGKIQLPGHPEAFQLDGDGVRIFVNVPTARQVAVVNRETGTVTATWPVEARANFPMALDEDHHGLLVGCREPACLLVMDSDTGKTLSRLDIDGDADDIYRDVHRGRFYVSCGEGVIDVIRRDASGAYAVVDRISTARGARTSLFDPGADRLYVAVPHRGDQHAEIRIYRPQP